MTKTTINGKEWSRLYVAYAAGQGRGPEEQMVQDEQDWPGGVMAGFMLFLGKMKTQYRREHAWNFLGDSIRDLDHWCGFVEGKVKPE